VAKRVGVDKWLFGVVLLLVLFGLVMVFSASAVMAKAESGSPYHYVAKQAMFALLGMIALTVLMRVDYRHYNNPRVVFPAMALTTLLLLSVFAMPKLNHTHRWFKAGFLTFQPSDLATPLVVLFLAYFLQSRIYKMDDWKGTILRAALPPLVFIGLIMKQPDLGTALVCAGVTMAMLYLAGMQVKWIGVAIVASAPVMFYMLWMVPFRRARMETYLHPELDPLGKGFHIMQSLIAVGTGGFRGLGLMEGRQKLYFLPEAWTDFIFANISEELGLVGSLALVTLFVIFGYRGLRAAFLSTDPSWRSD
jgi:cell division protein FtsW